MAALFPNLMIGYRPVFDEVGTMDGREPLQHVAVYA